MKTKTKANPKNEKIKNIKKSVTKTPKTKNVDVTVTDTTKTKPTTKSVKSTKVVKATKPIKPTKAIKLKKDISEVYDINGLQELTKGRYLNNKDLLAEVKLAKEKGFMTDRLAKMLMLLCMKYAKKGNFANYSYNDDMQAFAMLMLVKTWNAFDPEKSDNPFAFFTQCIHHSFIQFLNQEKRQRNIKDELLLDQGLTPSFGYEAPEKDSDENVDFEGTLPSEETKNVDELENTEK
jgi:hypothetical protein